VSLGLAALALGVDAWAKEAAAQSAEQQRVQRRQYYMAHKGALKAKGREYRLTHSAAVRDGQRTYQAEVANGTRIKRRRIRMGSSGTVLIY
jgi:hypothetical protein